MKNSLRSLTRKFHTWNALPSSQKFLILEATSWIIFGELLTWFTPYRFWIKRFGMVKVSSVCHGVTSPPGVLSDVKQIVELARKNLPWTPRCLILAFAGKKLLHRRGYPAIIELGLKKDESKKLLAHAWLRSDNYLITGGKTHRQYANLATID